MLEHLWSCDYTVSTYRGTYMYILLYFASGENTANIYDVYYSCELDAFLEVYYDMISAYINKTEGVTPVFDKAEAMAVLKAFSALDADVKAMFVTVDSGLGIYDVARELFISEAFTEAAGAVAKKLFALEVALYTYEVTESEVSLGSVKALLSELEAMYADLSGADAESFMPLAEIYDYYMEKCALLNSK